MHTENYRYVSGIEFVFFGVNTWILFVKLLKLEFQQKILEILETFTSKKHFIFFLKEVMMIFVFTILHSKTDIEKLKA